MSEQSNQLLEKDTSSTAYRGLVVVLEQKQASASADVKHVTAQHTAYKYLFGSVLTALAVHNMASQQCVSAHTKDHEKLLVDKTAVEIEFYKFQVDMEAKINRIQTTLDIEVKRANDIDSERVRLLVPEKSLKRQL